MTEYRIENYKPEFIEQQIELVLEATANWDFFNYPTQEQLIQLYSGEDFTPHTRYYAFNREELVGFLSSAFEADNKANLQFPFVKKGYEELQVILMEKAFATFQEAGVTEIKNNQQSSWTGAEEVITSFGFEKDEVFAKHIFINAKLVDDQKIGTLAEFTEVDPVKDKEDLIKVFSSEMTQPEEEIGAIIDIWPTQKLLVMNTITKEDGEIISHSMVYEHNQNSKLAQMTHISIYDEKYSNRRNEQLHYMLQELKSRGYETIQIFAIPKEEFESYDYKNYSIRKSIRYVKKLTPLQTA